LWAWALAIPVSSDSKDAAQKFVNWATSREYSALVAERHGFAAIPPGTRVSTYENQEYLDEAEFASMTLTQMRKASPDDSTLEPSPYTGVQFVAIPGFSGFATAVGQQISGALAGSSTVDRALANANTVVNREMRRAGYQD
jgi:sorbitol/mannitol transport system substrate-binding protein